MFEQVLSRIQERIRTRRYVMTLHAEDEMNDDNLTIYDVEHGVLTGQIVARQKDSMTGEWKYCIRGKTINDEALDVVVKLSPTDTLVIITVYVL